MSFQSDVNPGENRRPVQSETKHTLKCDTDVLWSGHVLVWSLRGVSTLTGCFSSKFLQASDPCSCSKYQEDLFPWRMLLKSVWETESCNRLWRLPMSASAPLISFPMKTHRRQKNKTFYCLIKLSSNFYSSLHEAGVDLAFFHVLGAKRRWRIRLMVDQIWT